jgi:hypothetical protein
MALDIGGYVWSWGNNGACFDSGGGRLGDNTTTDRSKAVKVVGMGGTGYLSGIVEISAGEGHSMALDSSGYVYCWGDNQYGQLGNNSYASSLTPVKVVGPDGEGYLGNNVAISAGFWHSLAIDGEGTIWVWGKGANGRLGIGTTAKANIPQRVPVVHSINQGTSYFRIQAAIDEATSGEVIEAEDGTYSEHIDFVGRAITVRSAEPTSWDVIVNTIIDATNYPSDDVVTFENFEDAGSVLSGFTITGGAQGIYCSYSSPTIISCLISGNSGCYAGMYCYNYACPSVMNCVFSENTGGTAGGMYNRWYSCPTVTNCTFTGNSSPAMCNNRSDPAITNCIFWDNGSGSQISNVSGAEPTVAYCCIQGGYPGGDHIISDDPLLTAHYHLSADSPCIDEGTNTPPGGLPQIDIDSEPRVLGPYVDMGADEYGGCLPVCHPDYDEWVLMGRPDCWCTPYQCDGDADVATSGWPFYYRVYNGDLSLIVDNWQKKIEDPTLNPCADVDHKDSGFPFYYRVYNGDLAIINTNWKKTDAELPGDCVECGRGQQASVSVSFDEMAKWLDEVWLDPEVRKLIEADRWERFVLSVLEGLQAQSVNP